MSTFLTTGALKQDIVAISASATPLMLTDVSPTIIHIKDGTLPQTIALPNAQTLEAGIHYVIVNNSSNIATITDTSATTVLTLNINVACILYLSEANNPQGTWAVLTTSNTATGGSLFVTAAEAVGKGTPVSINSDGELVRADIYDEELSYSFCGVSFSDYDIGDIATVLGSGATLFDVPGFSLGKHLFVSSSSTLTSVAPDYPGEAGAFILSVGVTTKNPYTGTTDIIINPRVVGSLA